MFIENHCDFDDMSNIINKSDLIIKFLKSARVSQLMQEKMMSLHEEFIHKDISRDFTVNQNENENSRLYLM